MGRGIRHATYLPGLSYVPVVVFARSAQDEERLITLVPVHWKHGTRFCLDHLSARWRDKRISHHIGRENAGIRSWVPAAGPLKFDEQRANGLLGQAEK